MTNISVIHPQPGNASVANESEQLVTFFVADQMFGISALKVRDVLREQPLTIIPLAPSEIAGTLNLRGHIVTALSLRARLGVEVAPANSPSMCVVVENGNDQICLIVDAVGDVCTLPWSQVEANPASLSDTWAELSKGIFRLDDRLLIVLDIARLVTF